MTEFLNTPLGWIEIGNGVLTFTMFDLILLGIFAAFAVFVCFAIIVLVSNSKKKNGKKVKTKKAAPVRKSATSTPPKKESKLFDYLWWVSWVLTGGILWALLYYVAPAVAIALICIAPGLVLWGFLALFFGKIKMRVPFGIAVSFLVANGVLALVIPLIQQMLANA